MENDNKHKQGPKGEIDRFSRFMFGNSRYRETYQEGENNKQDLLEQKEQSPFNARSNRFDDVFWGFRRKESPTNTNTTQNQIENFLNNVDFELLMETIDTFVSTSKQLKPLFKEIAPSLNRFSKKFKSK